MSTRIVTAIGTLAVIGASAGVASASPLLSGYGGPGQGSQVILGGTLLGGPGGSGEAPSATPLAAAPTPSSATQPARGAGSASGGRSTGPQQPPAKAASGADQRSVRSLPAGYPGVSSGQSALGISGQDILYALFVLALLGLTAVLTRGLARGSDRHVR